MTNSQAKSELMQIYMSLSEGKKQALDMAFKAMEQADGEYISKEKAIIQLSWDLSEVELPRIKESLDKLPSVAIPSADMFSDLKAEISMYENSDQSIDEMIQGIKSIISIYKR